VGVHQGRLGESKGSLLRERRAWSGSRSTCPARIVPIFRTMPFCGPGGRPNGSTWEPLNGLTQSKLRKESGKFFYTLPSGEVLRFSSGGRLEQEEDRNGNAAQAPDGLLPSKIYAEIQYASGPQCVAFTGEATPGDEESGSGPEEINFGPEDSLAPGASITGYGYFIAPGYYSPAHPYGNEATFESIILTVLPELSDEHYEVASSTHMFTSNVVANAIPFLPGTSGGCLIHQPCPPAYNAGAYPWRNLRSAEQLQLGRARLRAPSAAQRFAALLRKQPRPVASDGIAQRPAGGATISRSRAARVGTRDTPDKAALSSLTRCLGARPTSGTPSRGETSRAPLAAHLPDDALGPCRDRGSPCKHRRPCWRTRWVSV
jgi:hypothetical protein